MSRRWQHIVKDLVEAPWWISVFVAGAAYVGLGFVIPAMLAGQPPFAGIRGVAQRFAPWAALVLLIPAPLAALRQWQARQLLNRQKGIDSILALSWHEFERLVVEAYRRQGYAVRQTGGGSDGGIDLVIKKDGKHLLRCKHWKAFRVSVKEVRELLELVTAEVAEGGILITSGRFTSEAEAFARGKPLILVDGPKLVELIDAVKSGSDATRVQAATTADTPAQGGAVGAPFCPQCGRPMVLQAAKRGSAAGGQFWGCSGYPACTATIDFEVWAWFKT